MGSGNSVARAKSSDSAAKQIFKAVDANGDGKLSADELRVAIAKHAKLTKADWSNVRIEETLGRFDTDGDGKLDRMEFSALLDDLKNKRADSVPAAPRNAPGHWAYFLSHVPSESKDDAMELMSEWGKRECWVEKNMKDKSEAAIKEGVDSSAHFVALLSAGYFKSPERSRELGWALASHAPVVLVYAPKCDAQAVLAQAPSEYKQRLAGVDPVRLDSVDSESLAVGLKKIDAALDEARLKAAKEEAAEWAKLADDAKAIMSSGSPPPPPPAVTASAESQAIVIVYYKPGPSARSAEEVKEMALSKGAKASNVTLSDIDSDRVASDGMWQAVHDAGIANCMLPVTTIGGPLLSDARTWAGSLNGKEKEEFAAALGGDQGVALLAAKRESAAAEHRANVAQRASDLKAGKVDIKLVFRGGPEARDAHPGRLGPVLGIYKRQGQADSGGHYVYKRVDADNFFVSFSEDYGGWWMGQKPGQSSGFANCRDDAEAPDLIQNVWDCLHDRKGAWMDLPELQCVRVNADEEARREKEDEERRLKAEAADKMRERKARGVVVYGAPHRCNLSNAFEQMLKSHGVPFRAVNVDDMDAYWSKEKWHMCKVDPPPSRASAPEGVTVGLLPYIDAGGKAFYGQSPWDGANMKAALKACRAAADAAAAAAAGGVVSSAPEGSSDSCEFIFISAHEVRRCSDVQLPRLQDLRKTRNSWLSKKRVSRIESLQGALAGKYVAVSHRWESPTQPDIDGTQLKAIKAYLDAHPTIEYVWYDFCCMPQGECTAAERAEFGSMLPHINLLYLGCAVHVILDLSYLSRFWTQFEAWLSLQRCSAAGLTAASVNERRCTISCVHNAAASLGDELYSMWASKSPNQAFTILSKHDVSVTNQSDKDDQLPKILQLDQLVKEIMSKTGCHA